MGLYGNLAKKMTNKPFKLPSIFLKLCEVTETYTCTRVCYHTTSQTVAYLAFTTKTAPQQRLKMQLSRFRVHFKRENFFRKRK